MHAIYYFARSLIHRVVYFIVLYLFCKGAIIFVWVFFFAVSMNIKNSGSNPKLPPTPSVRQLYRV